MAPQLINPHLLAIVVSLAATPVAAQRAKIVPTTPVPIDRAAPELDACGSNGRVAGLKAHGDNFLAVRAGPSIKAREIDRLLQGDLLWICAEARGSWYGVVYAPDRTFERDCGVSSPGTGTSYRGPCSSGWVAARYVEIIAG